MPSQSRQCRRNRAAVAIPWREAKISIGIRDRETYLHVLSLNIRTILFSPIDSPLWVLG